MKTYSYSMSVLYQTMRIILFNCTNNLTALANWSTLYTSAFITLLQGEIAAAENMKTDQARTLEHETLRVEMKPLAEACRGKWQDLKRYIARAFGPDLEVTNWNAAGWQFYDDSSWDKLREMCSMANNYIAANESTLMDAGYMPADFKDVFAEMVAAFNTKYDAFLLAEENAMQGTADKIAANNAIYAKIVDVCLDGQACFRNDEVKKSQFSFQAVSELVKPVGAAGLKGTVTKDGKAQAGLIVELENESLHVITDADGAFDFGNRLASGKDTLIIRNGDEILAEEEVVINPGVTKREEVKLPVPPVVEASALTPPSV